jgi:hypothetical protein
MSRKPAKQFSNVDQLTALLKRYPRDPVDIQGVVLDYAAQTGKSLADVFRLNRSIYEDLFGGGHTEGGELLIKCLVCSDSEVETTAAECKDDYPSVARYLTKAEPSADIYGLGQSPPIGLQCKPGIAIGSPGDPESSSPTLAEQSAGTCRGNCDGTASSLSSLEDCAVSPSLADLLRDPEEALGYPVRAVVWQLSDLHFGKFNKLESDPRELAYQLGKAAVDLPLLAPDVIVISGDVTSVAAKREFEQFCSFCQDVSVALWRGSYPERLLVIPGNHDVTWKAGGKADQMAGFRRHVADKGVCVSPFGPQNESLAGGEVIVSRCDPNPETVPPYARVVYRKHQIEFLLLVSGYFSGRVPEQIRKLLRDGNGTNAELVDLLRQDQGAINREYLYNIADLARAEAPLRLAVIHHNPTQIGAEPCANRLAPQLLDTLHKHGVPVLVHGHVHLVEDSSEQRAPAPGRTYSLPCTTLCSECSAGGRGFSVHLVGGRTAQHLDTLLWQLSPSSAFTRDGLALRYRLSFSNGDTQVQWA